MALANVKVYNDGSHYYALLPSCDYKLPEKRGSRSLDSKFEKFKDYFKEATSEKLKGARKIEYIKDKFWQNAEDICEDLPSDADLAAYNKRYIKSLHAKRRRYDNKAYLNIWNWFITFTYDDDKITYEEFEAKIRKALSNLHTRNAWLYMGAREEGEENGRRHLHVLAHVDEGMMPGKLEVRSHYSTKKRRMVFYTANTLFDKYGISDFCALSNAYECRKKIKYLIKYIFKQGGNLIYSRGIKEYIEMVIDTDKDIVSVVNAGHRSRRAILADSLFVPKKGDDFIKNMQKLRFKKTWLDDLDSLDHNSLMPFQLGPIIYDFVCKLGSKPVYETAIYDSELDLRKIKDKLRLRPSFS